LSKVFVYAKQFFVLLGYLKVLTEAVSMGHLCRRQPLPLNLFMAVIDVLLKRKHVQIQAEDMISSKRNQ
jgi:hypothetical protein